MGCWNETCMVTRAPILHGDEVVVFILKGSGIKLDTGDTLGGICDNNFLFSPYPYAFRGQYNDYGSVEGVSDEQVRYAQTLVDISIKRFNKDELKVDAKRDVFYNIERGHYPGLTLAFVHKHIFDIIVKEMGSRTAYTSDVTGREDVITACGYVNDALARGCTIPSYAFSGATFKNYVLPISVEEAADACLFIDAANVMRITWMPNTTAGSQIGETKLWDLVHKQCSNDFDKAVEEHEEYREEGDQDFGVETRFGGVSSYVEQVIKNYARKPYNRNEDDDDDY